MSRLKAHAVAIGVAAIFAGILNAVYAMPGFTLLALPGVVLGLVAAGNTPPNNNAIILFGNWCFYSLAFGVFAEAVLNYRKRKAR